MRYAVSVGGRTLEVEVSGGGVNLEGRAVTASLASVSQPPLRRLVVDGEAGVVALSRTDDGWMVHTGGEAWDVTVLDERRRRLLALTAQAGVRRAGGVITAPMPGLVLRVEVEVGQPVERGAGVVVLEAMKMENEITAPSAGVVRTIHVAPGQAVEKGVALVELRAQG